VLIALHGGPEHHWSPRFDALFAALTLAGVTVIAPNQRGSTRYGQTHQEAIRGSWGGPDLEDICHLAETITAQRRGSANRLSLYGISYGAYLALLAASVQPDLWSKCVVIAPFLSGPRLYEEAGPKVRLLLERLDGLTEIHDAIGPRDLFRLAPRISARLLVIHGDQDLVVPVTQSRVLRDRLTAAGRKDGVDFVYKEIPGEGHNPLFDLDGRPIREVIARFLFTPSTEGR
jgi:dipeptidyl aminopeptidase/acylaminoacyl peptidase